MESTHPEGLEDGGEAVQASEDLSEGQQQQVDVASQAEGGDKVQQAMPVTGDDTRSELASTGELASSSVGDDRPPSEAGTVALPTAPSTSTPPHLDLATYPTPELLKLLASLLQQIAQANDSLRPNNPTMTVDEVTGVTQSVRPAPTPSSPADPSRAISLDTAATSPERASSSESSGQFKSKFSVDSLVIPPFRPKAARSESVEIDSHVATTPQPPPDIPVEPPSAPSSRPAQSVNHGPYHHPAIFTASRYSINHPSSILCFHARNIPSISIEAYLQRILKYCPITNEVFLSLLVYFDRMSRAHVGSSVVTDGRRDRGFAIDSYNVHRLVIAGITVASKFFSDVFYTNSRYAKVGVGRWYCTEKYRELTDVLPPIQVGGLPLSELNQLELQFLLLNDFRLVIPLEEMQKYADQLLVYWDGKQKAAAKSSNGSQSP